jgi:hypothetical protein
VATPDIDDELKHVSTALHMLVEQQKTTKKERHDAHRGLLTALNDAPNSGSNGLDKQRLRLDCSGAHTTLCCSRRTGAGNWAENCGFEALAARAR